jgi:endonuclease/exonuclease/phosphatase family metal-dependent hydrolase
VKRNTITIVTYNTQFFLQETTLIENLVQMAEDGADVFCLQEMLKSPYQQAIQKLLLPRLGPNWKSITHLGDEPGKLGHGTCIIWNDKKIQLKKSQNITLPARSSYTIFESAFAKLIGARPIPMKRKNLSAVFQYQNKRIRITNIHLDNNGGLPHRINQMRFIRERLRDDQTDAEIACGDFNTLDLLRTGKEKKAMQNIFGSGFQDASRDIRWTADMYYTDMDKGFYLMKNFIKTFQIHVRGKLDYIWVKNMEVSECKKLETLGSDHFPVQVTLYL